MAKNDSYLVERDGTWHYRRRVPKDLQAVVGLSHWKKSLKTAHKRDAEAKARALGAEHDALIARLRQPLAKFEALNETAELERDEGRFRLDTFAAVKIAEFEADPTPENGADAVAAITRFREFMPELARAQRAAAEAKVVLAQIVAAAERNVRKLAADEQELIRQAGGVHAFLKVAETHSATLHSLNTDLLGDQLGSTPEHVIAEKRAVVAARERHQAKQRQTLVKLGLMSDDLGFEDEKNPRVKTAVKQWFAARKQGTIAVKRHQIAVNRFVEMFGDVPVGTVTRQMIRDYLAKLETLPDSRRLPAKMRGKLVDIDDVPRIAAPTIERHLISIKALLTFCVEQDWIVMNPATGTRAPKDTRPKASKRRSFTRDERRQLLEHAKLEDTGNSDMPWFVQLAAYTGARLEELAQLSVTDIRRIDGVWVVDIHDLNGGSLKTAESVKQIPLHPAFRDDFVAWVQSRNGPRVFGTFDLDKEGRSTKNVSGRFARLMDRAGLTDPRLVLHSLRHTLKREMTNARVDPDVRRAILGHAPKDAHDRYDGPSLEFIAEEFGRMPSLF